MKLSIKPLKEFAMARLKEKSTIATLVTVVAGCLGVVVTPDQATVIVSTVAGVVSAIAVGTQEQK